MSTTLIELINDGYLTQSVLGLCLSHEIPVKELVPGDVDQFLSGISQVELGTDERTHQVVA